MSNKDANPKKKQPQRTCVGCRTVQDKRNMIRIVRTPADGIQIDLKGKLHGRGTYMHDQKSCWEKGLKGSIERALRTQLTEKDRVLLSGFMQKLD